MNERHKQLVTKIVEAMPRPHTYAGENTAEFSGYSVVISVYGTGIFVGPQPMVEIGDVGCLTRKGMRPLSRAHSHTRLIWHV